MSVFEQGPSLRVWSWRYMTAGQDCDTDALSWKLRVINEAW